MAETFVKGQTTGTCALPGGHEFLPHTYWVKCFLLFPDLSAFVLVVGTSDSCMLITSMVQLTSAIQLLSQSRQEYVSLVLHSAG